MEKKKIMKFQIVLWNLKKNYEITKFCMKFKNNFKKLFQILIELKLK